MSSLGGDLLDGPPRYRRSGGEDCANPRPLPWAIVAGWTVRTRIGAVPRIDVVTPPR